MDRDELKLTLGSPYASTSASVESKMYPTNSVQETICSLPNMVPALAISGAGLEPANKRLKLDKKFDGVDGGGKLIVISPEDSLAPVTPAQSVEFEVDQKKKHRFSGVSSDPSGRWEAYLYNSRRKIYLGNWDDEKDAARAHDRAAISIFGRQCTTINFPLSDYGDEVPALEMLPAEQVIFSLRSEAKHRRRLSKLANKKGAQANEDAVASNVSSPSGAFSWHVTPYDKNSQSFILNSPSHKLPVSHLQSGNSVGHTIQATTLQLQKGSRVLVAPPQPLLVGKEGKAARRHVKKRPHGGRDTTGNLQMLHEHLPQDEIEAQGQNNRREFPAYPYGFAMTDSSPMSCMAYPVQSKQGLIHRPTAHLAASQPGSWAPERKTTKCHSPIIADAVSAAHCKPGKSPQPPFSHNPRSPFKRVERRPVASSCLLSLGVLA